MDSFAESFIYTCLITDLHRQTARGDAERARPLWLPGLAVRCLSTAQLCLFALN